MAKKVLLIHDNPQGDLTTYIGWHQQDKISMVCEINDISISFVYMVILL